MSERSSKNQVVQLGYEASYGGGATVNRQLAGLTLDLASEASRSPNLPQGYNFASSSTMGKDFTTGDIGGALVFDELHHLFSMALGTVTPVAQTPATAQSWVWNLPNKGNISPKSARIEKGESGAGLSEAVNGVVVTDLDLSWNREGFTVGGSILGQLLDIAATLTTAGITVMPQIALDPGKIGVFIDSASGSLGTTRMLRAFEGGMSLGGLFQAIWPLNELKTSYDAIISAAPDAESTIMLAADAAGKALLTNLRNGDRRYLRWRVLGPQIGVGPATYMLQIDLSVNVVDVEPLGDSEGLYGIGFTFAPMADETWGQAGRITVVNTQTAY